MCFFKPLYLSTIQKLELTLKHVQPLYLVVRMGAARCATSCPFKPQERFIAELEISQVQERRSGISSTIPGAGCWFGTRCQARTWFGTESEKRRQIRRIMDGWMI